MDNYICVCVAGYTGMNCSVDIDDCNNNPCENGGMCLVWLCYVFVSNSMSNDFFRMK